MSKIAMVELGNRIKRRPNYARPGEMAGFETPVYGTVVYIHPSLRWLTLEYPFQTRGVFGETLKRPVRETVWEEDM